ncbi:adenine nucleotide alpha hydrolase [Ancylobacter dichloromethanicus]|uniref:TIGR00268 family protein n=1 Tax=Ancylobacter dichloromethanicus TaxID=518825 RepID=A0A9W6JBJ6_9HYPH|nr:adenine nucleotide alpha hydrolase [Ancylobacter dichloromethanicus]MBS7553209.1 adenine nucleotide alpha hydrolase [Ancylobacter dichloromethanicus]GLK72989.1 TIGR00268 family protein [Ancylobacter dichloromethanicus]
MREARPGAFIETSAATPPAERLARVLERFPALAVAVSGGVDSLTLASFAFAHGVPLTVIHAVSPAVPAEATMRVRHLAVAQGWELIVTGTGEFEDKRYRDNPVDRCYFCKTNLYDRVAGLTDRPIASGANLDDLGDYRPGLIAATERRVVHPLIEAGLAKSDVRALARALGLGEVAELPAQPCLASRVETGIAIHAADLAFVERAERRLAVLTGGGTLRCRITRQGVVVELGPEAMGHAGAVDTLMAGLCGEAARVYAGTRAYRRGAMFVGA